MCKATAHSIQNHPLYLLAKSKVRQLLEPNGKQLLHTRYNIFAQSNAVQRLLPPAPFTINFLYTVYCYYDEADVHTDGPCSAAFVYV